MKPEEILKLVDNYWSFDNRQFHTHSWHDKQKCLELLRDMLNRAAPSAEPEKEAGEKLSGKLLETERELYLAEMAVEKLNADRERLDWIQSMLTPADGYCEIFFAGLRAGYSDADFFQIECNPELFPTLNKMTLREAIDEAMSLFKSKQAEGRKG